MVIEFAIVDGPMTGKRFRIDAPGVHTFGRGDRADHQLLDEPSASRLHFSIDSTRPPRVVLQDLGSVNGVIINDQRIGGREARGASSAELRPGDRIRVGKTVLTVSWAATTPAAPPPDGWADSIATVIPGQPAPAEIDIFSMDSPAAADAQVLHSGVAPMQVGPASTRGGAPAAGSTVPLIEGYQDVAKIGAGASGDVFRALRVEDGRWVAIKMLRATGGNAQMAWERFLREITLTSAIKHPHVVEFIGAGQLPGALYLVIELMAGGDLARYIEEFPGPIPPAEACRVMTQVLGGMAEAHRHQIVHRDLKPANILFLDAERRVAKVSDLGLAKDTEDGTEFTMTGSGGGTPAYMAPEQISAFRHALPAADVFALAATLYEMLSRSLVYNVGPQRDFYEAIFARDIVPLSVRGAALNLPPDLVAVVDKGLAPEPEDRWPDAGAMLDALLKVMPTE